MADLGRPVGHDEWMSIVESALWHQPKGKKNRKVHSRIWDFANDVVCMDEESCLYTQMNSILREMVGSHPQEKWLHENIDQEYYDRIRNWDKA